jgi:hypothetical protein
MICDVGPEVLLGPAYTKVTIIETTTESTGNALNCLAASMPEMQLRDLH